jgi:hypothetical protein
MTAETFLLTLVGVLVVVYAFVALGTYLRNSGPQLIVPDSAEPWAPDAIAGRGDTPHPQGDDRAHATASGPAAPAGTRAGDLLRAWFAGKTCAICERPIPPIHRIEQHPGLMNPASSSHEVIAWEQFARDEHLPDMLETHAPVCSNCVMAETFRRQYPDLVVERPGH